MPQLARTEYYLLSVCRMRRLSVYVDAHQFSVQIISHRTEPHPTETTRNFQTPGKSGRLLKYVDRLG
jgi:hypothetical protein